MLEFRGAEPEDSVLWSRCVGDCVLVRWFFWCSFEGERRRFSSRG